MPIEGFPGVDFNIHDQKKVNLAGLFNTVLFLLEMQDGYISDVTEDPGNSGSGTVTPAGDVYAGMNVIIEITGAGDPGTATFKYSIDNGTTYSETLTTVDGSSMELDYGLNVTFGGTAFAVGDIFSFYTKEGFRKRVITKLTAKDYANKVTHKKSKALLDAYFDKADECYVIAPPNDTPGSITDTTGTVSGDGSVVVDGDPNRTATLKIEITTTGDIDSAEYIYYIDDVQMIGTPKVLSSEVYIKEANVTAAFTDGTPGGSFVEGDELTFDLEAVSSSNILLALTENVSPDEPDLLNNVKTNTIFKNVVIPSPLSLENMRKFKAMLNQRQAMNNFASYVLQADKRGTLTASAFKNQLIDKIQYFNDYRACIVADYMNTGTVDVPVWTPGCILLAQRIANYGVNVDAGQTSLGALDVAGRYDEDNMMLIDLELNNAGYTVIRERPDENGDYGYFFANTQVLSEEGSKFSNYIDVRTFFKALTVESYILNGYLKKGIVADDFVLKSLGETVQADTRAVMGDEIQNLIFEVISTAEEFETNGYIECRTVVDSLELINKFIVNSSLA